jgi:hypothetical protein
VGDSVPTLVGTDARLPLGGTEPVADTAPVFDAEVEAVEDGEGRGDTEFRELARVLLLGRGLRDSVGICVEVREKVTSRVSDAHAEGEEVAEGDREVDRERAGEGDAPGLRDTVRDARTEGLSEAEAEPDSDMESERETRGERVTERDGSGEALPPGERLPPNGSSVGKGSRDARRLPGEPEAPAEAERVGAPVGAVLPLRGAERLGSGLREGDMVRVSDAEPHGEAVPERDTTGERDDEGEPLATGEAVPPVSDTVGAVEMLREGKLERVAAAVGRGSTEPEGAAVCECGAEPMGSREGEAATERLTLVQALRVAEPVPAPATAASALSVGRAEAVGGAPLDEGAAEREAPVEGVRLAAALGVPAGASEAAGKPAVRVGGLLAVTLCAPLGVFVAIGEAEGGAEADARALRVTAPRDIEPNAVCVARSPLPVPVSDDVVEALSLRVARLERVATAAVAAGAAVVLPAAEVEPPGRPAVGVGG